MLKVAGGIILALVIIFVVAPVMCGMCVIGGGAVIEEQEKEKRVEQKAAAAVLAPSGESVMFQDNCNVRSKPNGRKIGTANKTQAYPIVERKGKWKKITLPDGREGWVGCKDTR